MIDRSATRASVSVSVAELLPGVGSVVPIGTVTVAEFTSVPVAVEATVPVTVKVALPPTARSISVLISPAPLAAPPDPAPA